MRHWEIVPPERLSEVWPKVEPWIAKACQRERDKHSPADFFRMLTADLMQLWVTDDAAAITDVIQFPNKRYARVTVGMGRNPHDLSDFIEVFETWARKVGCHGVQSTMRPGFAKSFSNAEWKKTHIMMEKEFSHA